LLDPGNAVAPTRVIDADIATISGAADKVIRVTGSPDWLLAVEFQAGHDTAAKLADLLLYNSVQGVVEMKESVTYQAILNEGKAEEARKMLLILGCTRLGEPAAAELEALNAITEVGRIEKIAERLQDASSWRELLGPISSSRRTPRRKPST
jgi:hypothetical protein